MSAKSGRWRPYAGALVATALVATTGFSLNKAAAQSSGATAAPGAGGPCSHVSVGPAVTVVSDATRDALGLDGWPDTALGVWRGPDERYRFVAPGFGHGYPPQANLVTRGTLDNPVAGGVVSRGPVLDAPPGYLWVGGGPIYRLPTTNDALQVLHLEQALPGNRFYATLHLGRMNLSTGQTRYLGPLVSPELPFATAARLAWNADVGTSSVTVVGNYLHVYFADYRLDTTGTSVVATNLSAARAPLPDVIAAASAGRVVPWHKYHDGAWNSPALGGPSSDLRPGHNPWAPHVVRHTSGSAVMIAGISPREMVLSVSPDGIDGWSEEIPLFREPQRWVMYPTVVGRGEDPSVIGDSFYLYYSQFESPEPDWGNATLKRRLVTCGGDQPTGTVAFIRYAGSGRHRVTTAIVSTPGFAPERGGLWYLLGAYAPGTRAVYGCLSGDGGYFTSVDPGCEATTNAILQTEGWIYTAPPDRPSVALYRCFLPGAGDHFVSVHDTCETAEAVRQGLLGYALSTSTVVLSRFSDGRELWDTTGAVSQSYAAERRWFIEDAAGSATVPLYGCWYSTPSGINHFVSVHATCEGATMLRPEGWIHRRPPDGRAMAPLYRCYRPAESDHFLSGDTTCDHRPGAVLEGLMGYAEAG